MCRFCFCLCFEIRLRAELVLTGLPTNLSDWILVNPKQKFFYRVNYDDANLAAIANQLVTDHTVSIGIPSNCCNIFFFF
jgi:hypothetical protein